MALSTQYECRIRQRREDAGLSQAELARRVGTTRQAVNLIERGKVVPSVVTAIGIAEVLGCAVTDLFSSPEKDGNVEVQLAGGRPDIGSRLRLWAVRGNRFALAENEIGEGFGQAEGRLVERKGPRARVRSLVPEDEWSMNILVAGCDPALGILRDRWHRREGSFIWWNSPTTAAVEKLVHGSAHMAGVHVPDEKAERDLIAKIPFPVEIVRFARWEQGWMVPRGNPLGFCGADDLTRKDLRFVNRPAGSGSRMLLESVLQKSGIRASQISTFKVEAPTHLACAKAIRDGLADVAIGLRAVAEVNGLDFLPLEEVAFDLLVPVDLIDTPQVSIALDLLQTGSFQRQLGDLPGYETGTTGQRITELA